MHGPIRKRSNLGVSLRKLAGSFVMIYVQKLISA